METPVCTSCHHYGTQDREVSVRDSFTARDLCTCLVLCGPVLGGLCSVFATLQFLIYFIWLYKWSSVEWWNRTWGLELHLTGSPHSLSNFLATCFQNLPSFHSSTSNSTPTPNMSQSSLTGQIKSGACESQDRDSGIWKGLHSPHQFPIMSKRAWH
jgi:hypothetical protein